MSHKGNKNMVRRWLRVVHPLKPYMTVSHYFSYLRDWINYSKLNEAEKIRLEDSFPVLNDNSSTSSFDAHYTFQSAWGLKKIYENKPSLHIDIGSQVQFVTMLSVIMPVIFLDFRPVKTNFPSIHCLSGDIVNIPFSNNSIASLSCLHVLEHIGLGRYGDQLNPLGTVQACNELTRVLKPKGNLFISLPIGKPKLCFNAHRIHSFDQIIRLFSSLDLIEFSAVNDSGTFMQNCPTDALDTANYGCGLFWFQKKDGYQE